MKKTFRNLLVVLFFVVTFKTSANDGLDLKVNNEQGLIIEVQSNHQGAELILKDEQGEIVFKDFVSHKDNYTKILDFKNLPQGDYTFILDKQFSISTSVIKKKEENIEIDPESFNLIFKPLYRNDKGRVLLYLANPEENKVEIKIFDKFGVLVGEIKCKDVVVKRTLDFSEVPAGIYTVKIKTKTSNFSNTLVVG